MTEELQQLLDKINREGVAKAEAEAASIVSKAQAEAAGILKDAEAKAAARVAEAEAEAAKSSERAAETIRQAARDVALDAEARIRALLESYLARDLSAALADPRRVADVAFAAVKALLGDSAEAEVHAVAELADALRAQFAAAALAGVTVVTDEAAGTGFSVKLDGGRVEHDFTGPALRAALAARLRPALAKLVNG